MGFWDKFNNVARAFPVVGTYLAGAVDAARAANDDDESTTIKSGLLKQLPDEEARRRAAEQINSIPGVHPTLTALAAGYSYGFARPVSTGVQMLADADANIGHLFGTREWKESWERSREVSPGQAIVAGIAPALTVDDNLGIEGKSWLDIAKTGEKDDPRFNRWFSLASGTVDGVLAWTADPLVIAGKGVKVARIARTNVRGSDVEALAKAAPKVRVTTKTVAAKEAEVQVPHGYVESEPGIYFHGSSRKIDELGPADDAATLENLYGPGFYTTNNRKVAQGYSNTSVTKFSKDEYRQMADEMVEDGWVKPKMAEPDFEHDPKYAAAHAEHDPGDEVARGRALKANLTYKHDQQMARDKYNAEHAKWVEELDRRAALRKSVNSVKWKGQGEPKFYDLDRSIRDDFLDALQRHMPQDLRKSAEWRDLVTEARQTGTPSRELYGAWVQQMVADLDAKVAAGQLDEQAAHEMIDRYMHGARKELLRKGYDGFSHSGGHLVGKDLNHQVRIYFDTSKLEIAPNSRGAFVVSPAQAEESRSTFELVPGDTTGLSRRQRKVVSEVDSFVRDTDGFSASELMRFKAFRSNATLAHAFAAADGNHELKKLTLRYAMGDRAAGDQLRAQAEHIAARIDRMNTDLDDVLFADELAAPGSLFEHLNQQSALDAMMKEKKSAERTLDFYQRILPDEEAAALAERGTALDTHSIGLFGSVGERTRITSRDMKDLIHERQYVIQDGVGDLPVRVARQVTGRRPEGMVDHHDAEQAFEEMSNMLRKVRGLSPESRQRMLDGLVAAPDDNARMLSIQAIESNVFQHIGKELGYTEKEIQELLAKTLDERGRIIKHVKERAFSGATGADGVPVDAIRLDDGTLIHRPLLETHLANSTPTLDIDHVYRVLKHNADRVGALRAGAGEGFSIVKDAGMLVNDLWKFQTLLRLGYLQRNIIDNQLRLYAYLGGIDHIRTMAENVGQGFLHKLSSISAASARQDAVVQVERLNKEIEGAVAGRPIKYNPTEEDPRVVALIEEREKWQQVVDNGPNPDDFSRHFGQGEVEVGPYKRPDAFGKTTSEYERYRNQVSGEDMWANFAGAEMDRLLNKMRSDEWVTITGESPQYADHYLRVVNNQFRQSEIAMRLLRGDSPESVVAWLKSGAGRKVRRRLVHRWDSPEELVAANVANINHVIPDPAVRRLASERNLRKGDVDRLFTGGQHTRPPINAAQMGFAAGQGKAAEAYNKIRNGYFRWMSSMPDNVMGRHPIYRQLYRGRLRQIMQQADPKLKGTLSVAEQRVLDEQARIWARREMKRIMFDVSSKSNVAHFARFVAPFFAAWEDSMVKYGRLISRDPSLIPRSWTLWTAPNDSALVEVVDINGNVVDSKSSVVSDNEYVRIPAGFLGKKFSQGIVDIPKSSLNIALQGDPFWLPGFGPMVQAPVNEIAKTRPEAEEVVSFVLPYGTEDAGFLSWKKFLSSGLRNASKGENDRMYSRMMVQIAQTETERFRQGLRDTEPTPGEIAARTRKLYMLKVATSFTSPFSIQYRSPYQFYIDEYHRYQEKHGFDADKKFLKDYGDDFYIFSTSLSKNTTGIQSSQRADAAARKVKGLIAEHPAYGWFFVGPDNTGTFSPGVYTAQQLRRVSPTSTETYRGTYSPDDALARNNAELGWIEYQKLSAKLEAIRIQRGLPSMAVKGAEDLRAIKAQWLSEVREQPWGHDWLNDYEARDAGTTRKFLEAAAAATTDKRIAGRPDIQTMSEYLDARAKFQQILAARKRNGGSASLSAQSNGDLAAIWAQITGLLVDQNVTFGDVYARMLENDDLTARID